MKKTKITALTLAFAMVAFLGWNGVSFAWSGNHMGGGNGAGQNLTPEQYNKLQQLKGEYFNLTNPLQQQLYAKQSELKALYYNNSSVDQTKVQSLTQEIADLQAKLYAANVEFEGKINAQGIPVNAGWHNNGNNWGHGSGHGGGHGGGHRGGGWGY